MTYGQIHFSVKSWVLLYELLLVKVLRTGFGLGCATSWSQLMWSMLKVVAVPWGNISLPLYESTESCESLLQVEWKPDLSSQQNIFSLDYGMEVDIMWCWKLNRHGVFLRLGWYLLCCALVTKVFVLQIFMIDIHQWGQFKGSSNSKYKSVSISYQPELFLTDRYSQYILCVG